MAELNEGDKAPDFTARTQSGEQVSLADFSGKYVILYFYPKDDTPGCTKEACAFRDQYGDFEQHGAVVLGVSADSVEDHQKFVTKYELPFTLLADEDKSIIDAYGAWGTKNSFGKTKEGIIRSTFVIGPDGTIVKKYPKVKPEQHAGEILELLQSQG